MSYPAYAETKASGVEWLGDVPAHWAVKRLKNSVASARNGIWGDEPQGDENDLVCVRVADFDRQTNTVRTDKFTVRNISRSEQSGRVLQSGDLLLEKSGGGELQPVGFVVSYNHSVRAVCSNFVARLQPSVQADSRYFCYVHSAAYAVRLNSRSIKQTTGIQNLDEDAYLNELAPLPPRPEQQRIAAFLDRKTAELDAVLRLKERQLELLAEKRQALISQAVTRGLDPTAPLKPSGIPWLGDVPGHWEVTRMRYITSSLQTGPFGSQLHSEEYVDDGIPIVNPANIESGRIVPNMRCTVDLDTFSRLERHALQEGDIVFGRRGEMGRCALVTEKEQGWLCGTGSLRMRFHSANCYPAYMSLQLSLDGIRDWLTLESVGSTMDNLNTEILARIPVGLPPVPEQKAIVAYLDRETARMDGIAQAIRAQIGKVREYRQALISAAVTGKIDVRGEGLQGAKPND